jgi:hypothetical protein
MGQCLAGRIDSIEKITKQADAWQNARNNKRQK